MGRLEDQHVNGKIWPLVFWIVVIMTLIGVAAHCDHQQMPHDNKIHTTVTPGH